MDRIKYQENPQYRDRLFRMLFGDEEHRDNIASLCSALEGREYTAEDIEKITTIDDAIYIKMKNDVSFLLDSYMFLIEQQSTVNPNMPIRGLMYFGELYSAYIDERMMNVYSTSRISLPTPRYVVLYNGTSEAPPVVKYRLSDSFINEDRTGDFQWTATMYNLNRGKNDSLLESCRPLKEYMALVGYVRDCREQGIPSPECIDMAIDRCIEEGILVDFLTKHRAEVRMMIITDQKRQIEIMEADAERKGMERGMERGMEKGRNEAIEEAVVYWKEQGKESGDIKDLIRGMYKLDTDAACRIVDKCFEK